jgi:hypothetical protein
MTITTIGIGATAVGTLAVTLNAPTDAGTIVSFLNGASNDGVLILPDNRASQFFTIAATPDANGIYEASLAGTITNFQTVNHTGGGPGNLGDYINLQVLEALFNEIDGTVSAAQQSANSAFFNEIEAAGHNSAEQIFIHGDGSMTWVSSALTLNHLDTLVLDNIVDAMFGPQWANDGATLALTFADRPDPNQNGAQVTDVQITPLNHAVNPCFAAGTKILTPGGEVAVEVLAPGDLVITHAGEEREIVWVGRREIDLAAHPRPEAVRPVVIEAGALGNGMPARRLRVSPDHALFLDGVLVPAKALLNWTSIRQDVAAASVVYVHIELARHDVIFAEGAPAETFLDTGHRGVFDNEASQVVAHPVVMQQRRDAGSCAPLCLGGAGLEAIRQRLAARQTGVRLAGG